MIEGAWLFFAVGMLGYVLGIVTVLVVQHVWRKPEP